MSKESAKSYSTVRGAGWPATRGVDWVRFSGGGVLFRWCFFHWRRGQLQERGEFLESLEREEGTEERKKK